MSIEKQDSSDISTYGPPVAWAILIFLASSIPQHAFPQYRIFSQDKLIHMGVFAVLSFLVYRAFRLKRRSAPISTAVWVTLVICAVYGALDEFHQLYVPGRSCDVYDLIADVLGAGLVLAVAFLWERRRSGGEKA